NLFGDGSSTEALERLFVWAHVSIILGFLVYLPYSKPLHIAPPGVTVLLRLLPAVPEAPAHRHRRVQRLLRPPPQPGPDRAARLLRGPARGGDAVRCRPRRRHDLEGDARHGLLPGVRPLPGRLPRLHHRQGAV